MKNIVFIFLFIISTLINAQIEILNPSAVVISASSIDSRAHGLIGGQTYSHQAIQWPLTGLKFGFPATLPLAINGYNNLPPNMSCSGMTDLTYSSVLSNFSNGLIVYTGTTNYRYLNTSSVYVTTSLQVKVEIDFSIPVLSFGSYFGVDANQNFNYNIIFKTLSPSGALYFAPGTSNVWTPSILLFDYLHTDPNSSICTSYNQGKFYNMCDDAISCTENSFQFETGCVFQPNNQLCDDMNFYTCEVCSASSGCLTTGFAQSWFFDSDSDGFGFGVATDNCTSPGPQYVLNNTDCNDLISSINPNGIEICNGLDDDCDFSVDDGISFNTYFFDGDGDGFGFSTSVFCSTPPSPYVSQGNDCDDANSLIHPGTAEVCDNVDQNCDGSIDAELFSWFFHDVDGDGFGWPYDMISACSAPLNFVSNSEDCDDTNNQIYPGANFASVTSNVVYINQPITFVGATQYYLGIPNYQLAVVFDQASNQYVDYFINANGFWSGGGACCFPSFNAAIAAYPNFVPYPQIYSPITSGSYVPSASGTYTFQGLYSINGGPFCLSSVVTVTVQDVLGCMDMNACNYNAGATLNDGSCSFASDWYLDVDNDGYYVNFQSACVRLVLVGPVLFQQVEVVIATITTLLSTASQQRFATTSTTTAMEQSTTV